jgi:hypothetical protein
VGIFPGFEGLITIVAGYKASQLPHLLHENNRIREHRKVPFAHIPNPVIHLFLEEVEGEFSLLLGGYRRTSK